MTPRSPSLHGADHMHLARLACLQLVFGFALFSAAHAQTLRIFHIDVENGDSTLFVSPSGQTLLVDSGNNGQGERIKGSLEPRRELSVVVA